MELKDQELLKKYRQSKYDDIVKQIAKFIESNLSIERIKDYNSIKDFIINDISMYENEWEELVYFVDKVLKNQFDPEYPEQGILISPNEKNDFNIPSDPRSAWQLLKKHLDNKKIYSFEEMQSLEKGTQKILNSLSVDTYNREAIKGMVVGYVQSGKTTSIESLITMAADWGFNLFIMLSGIIENLRQQNLSRLKSDIEYGENGNIHWVFSPNLNDDKAYELLSSGKKIVTVCLKNSTRLKYLKDWLFSNSNVGLANHAKVLIIDDEADQASLNSKDITKAERSKINELITDIVGTKQVKAMNYIGYTATPYGNFLNEYGEDTIYPKDFIYTLPKSTQYIGPKEIFGDEFATSAEISDGLDIIRNISSIYNENTKKEDTDLYQMREIEKGESNELPQSLKDAVCWFLCTVAIFRYKNKAKPVSMLIHSNRKVDTHKNISNAIEDWLKLNSKNMIIDMCRDIYEIETNKFTLKDFKNVMVNYNKPIDNYPTFEEIKKFIEEIINEKIGFANISDNQRIKYHKGINMVIDNCKINSQISEYEFARLVYPEKDDKIKYATAFIIVGGDTLSRGLTIEGLTTTYFCRKTTQMDTLMQMGRWFGYRIGYELLPRIWVDKNNLENFIELTSVETDLREDLTKYDRGTNPSVIGPMIRTSYKTQISITAKNKSQSAIPSKMSYVGARGQTTLFEKNDEVQLHNTKLTEEFLNSILSWEKSKVISSNLVAKNIEFDLIKNELLKKFKFCKNDNFFGHIDTFCDWMDKIEDEQLKKWNIIIASNSKEGKEWNICNNKLHIVSRSEKPDYENKNYFSIGSLRSTNDIISDCELNDVEKKNILNDTAEIIRYRENDVYVPQLIIYKVDKDSKPSNNSKRKLLETNVDLIGMYLFIPGDKHNNFVETVTINIPKSDENILDENEE